MRVVGIIQARMGSERLPGKVLEPLGESTVLGHLIDRMKTVKRFDDLVVAIPDTELNNLLADYVRSQGVGLFRGSEEDVLDRYLAAARTFKADQVVRLSGEDPFRDPEIVSIVLEHHLDSGADLTTNWVPRTFPVGMEVEVFKIEALEKLEKKSTRSDCREGVSRMAYFVSGFLRVENVPAPMEFHWPDLWLSVDTPEDLNDMTAILAAVGGSEGRITLAEIIETIHQNPELAPDHVIEKRHFYPTNNINVQRTC